MQIPHKLRGCAVIWGQSISSTLPTKCSPEITEEGLERKGSKLCNSRGQQHNKSPLCLFLKLPRFSLLLLLILITSQAECREFSGEGGCALPVQSAVPALFSLYHISRTSRIYMDFPPPLSSVCFKRCLVWGCFSQPQFVLCLWPVMHLDLVPRSKIPWPDVSPVSGAHVFSGSEKPTTFEYCNLDKSASAFLG